MDSQRNVRVRYFASLREKRGLGEELICTSASTPAAVYEELSRTHGFSLGLNLVRFAVNGEFVEENHPLKEGDELCFIPPVAGG